MLVQIVIAFSFIHHGVVVKCRRCFGRATFDGEMATSTCQEDGRWSHPVPRCLSKITV